MDQRHLYTATMILDSVSPASIRLSTIHVHMPRIILAEFNTHRALSKNARSTRAVPTTRLIHEVCKEPYVPLKWLKNKPGMQASEPMNDVDRHWAEVAWLKAARDAAHSAEDLFKIGLHKQWAGRVLEPFMWVDELVSGTEWANFMALRDHGDAQPEIELVAQRIRDCMDQSEPSYLEPGMWHLPYIRAEDWELIDAELLENCGVVTPDTRLDYARRISAARCARLSIKPFDGNGSITAELDRFDRLVSSQPVHASPTEHQATPDVFSDEYPNSDWESPDLHGNFVGWIQHRKLIPFNTVTEMPARRH